METPPANSDPDLQLNTSQLSNAAAAAAWHVLGLLLSHGGPARPSELVSTFMPFYPTPEFICFLCSIPNSPLQLVDDNVVTFSQIGIAAVARFFANSDVIRRYLILPESVPRLLANVRSNNTVRTYCRKRKRLILETEDFPYMKKKSYFRDFTGENNLNQMVMRMPGGFQCQNSQDSGTPSRFSKLSEYDNWKLEKSMFKPSMFSKSSSGQLGREIENVQYEYNETEVKFPNREGHGYLHQERYKSYYLSGGRFPHMHKITAEGRMTSVPLKDLSPLPRIMGHSGKSEVGEVDICTSSKLEADEQIIHSQEENEAVIQGSESATEDVNEKRNEVLLHDSGRCRCHEENLPMDSTYKDISHMDIPEKSLNDANSKALLLERPRTEDRMKSQADMLNHRVKNSVRKSNHNAETHNRRRAICTTMDNCKCFSDKGPEQLKGNKNRTLEKQKTKCNCDNKINTKEKSEASMENRRRASSISNKHIEEKPFPDFEPFIVEEEEGSGGYGRVYRARRKVDGVKFAIKCPHVNANKSYVHNEMKMLERLGGKNFVIKYEGSFSSGDADCIVLQHVEHDRPEILKKEINIIDLQWYGYCLFKALAGLHKQGIVHRDVKPGNFLYTRKVNKGYLIDFNLALDMRRKYGTVDNSKAGHNLHSPSPIHQAKSLLPVKSKKLMNARSLEADNKNARKVSKSLLPPGNMKNKVDKARGFTDSNRNIIKSQGGDGSGITSAKDATSTRTLSAERLREPLPSQGRKELLSLVQEARQGKNHESVNAPLSKRKRVAAPPGDADTKFLYPTPMPLHTNEVAVLGAGLLKSKGDGKHRREGPCVGTKGFKAPEVLFRSVYQGPKSDIWSAGVTLLYMMIGRQPFTGDTDQNIKEIAKLRGSEDLWEVAKLHDHESLFPKDLLDTKYLSPVKLRDWCARNPRRPDFLEALPRSLFDLVDKCLIVNPRHRITAEEALRHEFFRPCHEAIRKQSQRLQQQGLDSLDPGATLDLHGLV